ncbi:MAG: LL-diaminopimelate aminotransferase [Elusimicrobia bacterium]|jgi:LL-diaminopimelate aminotransferase|nr:LL-diaminopimelate aminotransferase [Elusimicrobiota bacterium]
MKKKINIEPSRKLKELPPYLFGAIDVLKREARNKNLDVIDLGMGNPDIETPAHVVERLCDTVKNHPKTHRYPQAKGMPKFRRAVAAWYKRKFNVDLNPENEVLALVGSKEGVAHVCMAYLDPGDIALVTNPCYPVHRNGIILAGGRPYDLPISEENSYIPDLKKIPAEVASKAKIMFINYPNNPTAAVLEDTKFFEEVVEFARKYNIVVCQDFAYSEITYDGYKAPSFMEVEGAKDVGMEFHSFSKTYNMAGWRVGYCVGGKKLIKPLEKMKSYLDYGVFTAIQLSGIKALEGSQQCVKDTVKEYRRRQKKLVSGLNKIGWKAKLPKATMYLWMELPENFRGLNSLEFAELLIEKTGIAVAPGIGFGSYGEGFVRMAVVTHYQRFHDALIRLKEFLKEGPPK